mmetsp:Transcript_16035/g.31334  ORF Transcript_16035/g.31334 Transcript_16035/m.31334 type:complete len:93 (+) Transcript_16035:117-395(+)
MAHILQHRHCGLLSVFVNEQLRPRASSVIAVIVILAVRFVDLNTTQSAEIVAPSVLVVVPVDVFALLATDQHECRTDSPWLAPAGAHDSVSS